MPLENSIRTAADSVRPIILAGYINEIYLPSLKIQISQQVGLADSLVFRLNAIGELAADLTANLEAFNRFANQQSQAVASLESFGTELTRITDEAFRIEAIFKPMARLKDSFARIATLIASVPAPFDDVLAVVEQTVILSRDLVVETNDFFSHRELSEFPGRLEGLPSMTAEMGEKAEDAREALDYLLHEGAADSILAGNGAVGLIRRLIRDEIDSALDERFHPSLRLDWLWRTTRRAIPARERSRHSCCGPCVLYGPIRFPAEALNPAAAR